MSPLCTSGLAACLALFSLVLGAVPATAGSPPPDEDLRTHWTLEPTTADWVRLRNRATGDLLHLESRQAYAEATPGQNGWHSAQWRLEPVEGTDGAWSRIRCRWSREPDYLHAEDREGYAQHASATEEPGTTGGWYSAMWQAEGVPGTPHVRLRNRYTGAYLLDGGSQAKLAAGGAPTVLPLEAIGPDGYAESAALPVTDGAAAARLHLTLHRPAYRDASTNPARGAKASVRLNGGPWVGITNETAACAGPEAAYGCLSDAYHTLRLSLPAAALGPFADGRNALELRFNGTDGFTSGFRVLALDVRSASGASLLAPGAFVQDDPAAWAAPSSDPADIAEGRRLWEEAPLVESPLVDTELRASCASCHARDGRDLKYFNYSNWAIQERAQFHRLSPEEAEQIASFVRSLDAPAPINARPWNPPYQPGPGLDSRPVEEWAAGAGLEWVLEEDADMLPYLFPGGTSPEAVAAVTDTRATLNVREMPIALQLPDWNAWLPEVAPEDTWGDAFFAEEPHAAYEAAHAALAGGGADRMRTDPQAIYDGELRGVLDRVRKSVNDFVGLGGPQPCRDAGIYGRRAWVMLGISGPSANLQDGDPSWCEGPMRSVNHWNAVKQWELFQTYALDDASADVYPYGEARSWTGQHRHVFGLAPHRTGNNSFYFQHQTKRVGAYFNTAWYQLQVVLQAGNRDPRNHRPPDWKYHQNHLWHAADESGRPEPLRQLQGLIKMHQNLDMRPPHGFAEDPNHPLAADRGPLGDGWWLWHISPVRFHSAFPSANYDYRSQMMRGLDEVEPGLHKAAMDALLRGFLAKSNTYDPGDWQRGNGAGRLDPADYVPTAWDGQGSEFDERHHADVIYRLVPRFREMGLDGALVNGLADWGASLWPLGDWAALRVPVGPVGETVCLAAEVNGRYVAAEQAGAAPLIADRSACRGWERFSVEDAGAGAVALRAGANGRYVAVQDDGRLVASAASVGPRTRFLWEDGGGVVCLKSAFADRYVAAEGAGTEPLAADRAACGLWERFLPSPADPARYAAADGLETGLPEVYALEAIFPNPFGERATVRFALPEPSAVRLSVYDVLGRRVAVLAAGEREAGYHEAMLDGSALPAGLYLVRLEAGGQALTRRVTVAR